MKTFGLLLFLILLAKSNSEIKSENPVDNAMRAFLNRVDVDSGKTYETIGFFSDDSEPSLALLNYLVRRVQNAIVVVGTSPYQHYLETIASLVCFISKVKALEEMIDELNINPTFSLQGRIRIIFSKPFEDVDWLKALLEFLWSRKVLRYVIVYEMATEVKMVRYNPFLKTIYSVQPPAKFPNDLNNMYGYTMTVAMLLDKPRNVLSYGRLQGEDANMVRIVANKFNGKLKWKFYDDYYEIQAVILNGSANFSFTKHFAYWNTGTVIVGSYPTGMDYLVIAVPTAEAIPQYKYLFLVFHSKLWLCLLGIFLLMTAINTSFTYLTGFPYQSLSECALFTLQIFLNSCYVHINKAKASLKILLVSWLLFSLLVATGFNTALRSSLVNQKYYKEVDTFDELLASDIPVGINKNYYSSIIEAYPPLYNKLVNTSSLITKLTKYTKDMSYCLPLTFMVKLVHRKDKNNRYFYRLLGENLMVGHSVYNYPYNSPFQKQFDYFIMLLVQFGLSEFGIKPFAEKNVVSGELVKLSVEHLQTHFYILLIGCSIAVVVFFGEILCSLCCHCNKIY